MQKQKEYVKTQYGVAGMLLYYGIMVSSKALGMDSSNSMYYLMFGLALVMLLYKYFVSSYTLKEIFLDVVILLAGLASFVISRDMTVLLLAITVVGFKDCNFRQVVNVAFTVRLVITSVMIIGSFVGIFDQGETAQTTTSFQDITVYNFGYSTANNAYINLFVLMALFVYVNYERINFKMFAGTTVVAMLMYTFTNCRTGTLLFFIFWIFIFLDKFLFLNRARSVFLGVLAWFPIICAVFSFIAMASFNPDGGTLSRTINRIFSGRLNITHRYFETLGISLFPHKASLMDSIRYFGFIDNAYMSVLFHDGLIVALILAVFLMLSNLKMYKENHNKELIFVATFCVYAMMEEFAVNPVVNPFILLICTVIYKDFLDKKETIKAGKKHNPENILLVHNYYKIAGGEDTVVANEMKMLQNHGHKVYLYSRSNKELDSFSKLQKAMLLFTSVFSFRTVRDIKRLVRDYEIDVIHVHNTLSLVSPSVFYAARKCNVPVVMTMHNFRLLCPGGSFYRMKDANDTTGMICEECVKGGLKRACMHRCYRDSLPQTMVSSLILLTHRILGTYKYVNFICLSEFNAKKLLKLNAGKLSVIKPSKVFVKPNFTFDKALEAPECKKEDYYVCVGRLEKLKGVDIWLQAFSEMPDKKLVVLGNGPLEDYVKEKIKENNIKNITLMGRVVGSEYAKIVGNAKALVATSQCYETFGMSIAEGYSLRTPAIVGDVGNIAAIVIEGVTGFHFEYNNAKALVSAIEKFENSDINVLSDNARKYYEERLTQEKNYHLLKNIYETI